MPYAKHGYSKQLANLRRSYTERVKRIERNIQRGVYGLDISDARAAQQVYLQKASELYATRYENGKRVMKSTAELERLIAEGKAGVERSIEQTRSLKSSSASKNEITQKEINWTSSPDLRPLSKYSEKEVSTFYRLTQDIWGEDKTGANRNVLIMDYFGIYDLEEVFDLVMKSAKDFAARKARGEVTSDVAVSSEDSPELQEPQQAGDNNSYAADISGFTFADFASTLERLRAEKNKSAE